jgi:hypothetical protein
MLLLPLLAAATAADDTDAAAPTRYDACILVAADHVAVAISAVLCCSQTACAS